jgi:hypothetical protein
MPESPRKRSTPARKAEPEVVPAEPTAAKPAAKTAKKAAKSATQAAAPVEAVAAAEVPAPTKKAAKAAKKATPEPVEEPAAVPAAEDGTDADESEFLNRAARRAKGRKGTGGQPVAGKGASYTGRGAVPGQRQWGARRSGG